MATIPQPREGTAESLMDPLAGRMVRPRSCFICKHVEYVSSRGGMATQCGIVSEPIDSEALAAAECDLYQEDRHVR